MTKTVVLFLHPKSLIQICPCTFSDSNLIVADGAVNIMALEGDYGARPWTKMKVATVLGMEGLSQKMLNTY